MPLVNTPKHRTSEVERIWEVRARVGEEYAARPLPPEMLQYQARQQHATSPEGHHRQDHPSLSPAPQPAAAPTPTPHSHAPHGQQHAFLSEAQQELRALQDAFRQRRDAEYSLAFHLRDAQHASPSRAHHITPIPETDLPPHPQTTARSIRRVERRSMSPLAVSPSIEPPILDRTPGKTEKSEENEKKGKVQGKPPPAPVGGEGEGGGGGGGEKKPRPKKAWDPVFATQEANHNVSLLDTPLPVTGKTMKEKDFDLYMKSLYSRGQAFQGKKQKEMEKKVREGLAEGGTHKPLITPYAAEIRENNKRDDKVLGAYFYDKGAMHKQKRSRTLEKKRIEVDAEQGMQTKPTISEHARELRESNKPSQVGQFLYDKGKKFQNEKQRHRALKTKEVHNEDNCSFTPTITEKTRVLATQAEARQAGLIGTAYRKEGRLGGGAGPSAPEARLYDVGLMFNFQREQTRAQKRDERQREADKSLTHTPALNERSRRLAARKTRTASHPPSPPSPSTSTYPLGFNFATPHTTGGLDGFDLDRTYAAADVIEEKGQRGEEKSASPYGSYGLYRDVDADSPGVLVPDLDDILSEVRVRQEMRRMGV